MVRHRVFRQDEILDAPKEVLFEKVAEVLDEEALRSNVFNPLAESTVPRYEITDLSVGRVLGRGGFGVVHEIKSFRRQQRKRFGSRIIIGRCHNNKNKTKPTTIPEKQEMCMDDTSTTVGTSQHSSLSRSRDDTYSSSASASASSRFSLSSSASSSLDASDDRLVIKRVAKEFLTDDKVTFLKGTIDLATEAKYLASLCHPHLMKLRGLSNCGPTDEGFFVLLDRLYETLSERLTKWMHTDRNSKGPTGLIISGGGGGCAKKQQNLLCERLMVSCHVADALDYLHDKRIIYRDLKPSNIGFDAQGVLKVFDLGLAKELNWAEHVGDDLYRMTGFTGALRYMAPEIANHQPYNLKADSYSWAMLMWYIMALEPPFGMFTPRMMKTEVFENHFRPPIFFNWPKPLAKLMEQCWQVDIHQRAEFSHITEVLRQEVSRMDPSWLTKRPTPMLSASSSRLSMNLVRRFSNRF